MHLKKSSLKKTQKERREELLTVKSSTSSHEALWAKTGDEPGAVTRESPRTAHSTGGATDHQLLCRSPMAELWSHTLGPRNGGQYRPGWVTNAAPTHSGANVRSKGRKELKGLGRRSWLVRAGSSASTPPAELGPALGWGQGRQPEEPPWLGTVWGQQRSALETSSGKGWWTCSSAPTQGQNAAAVRGTYGLVCCLGTHALLPDGEVERVLHICL